MENIRKAIIFYFSFAERPMRRHSRQQRWKEINECDLKVFVAHLLVMSVVKRSNFSKYWTNKDITRMPFFGKYMGRNTVQMIMSNLHAEGGTGMASRIPPNAPNYDPLHKIRKFANMVQERFKLLYSPTRRLSIDEASCPFRGRSSFRVYNKDKPNKWSIKFYEVCEVQTGYICAFDIFGGKGKTICAENAPVLDPNCTTTTKVVLGLLDSVQLLDKGFFIYLDNFYNSYELQMELHSRNTYCCGTLRRKRRGNSKAVELARLKKGECCFRRNGPVLQLKWTEKKGL